MQQNFSSRIFSASKVRENMGVLQQKEIKVNEYSQYVSKQLNWKSGKAQIYAIWPSVTARRKQRPYCLRAQNPRSHLHACSLSKTGKVLFFRLLLNKSSTPMDPPPTLLVHFQISLRKYVLRSGENLPVITTKIRCMQIPIVAKLIFKYFG